MYNLKNAYIKETNIILWNSFTGVHITILKYIKNRVNVLMFKSNNKWQPLCYTTQGNIIITFELKFQSKFDLFIF